MTNKFLVGVGAAFFAVFALGIAAVVGISNLTTTQTSPLARTKPAEVAPPASPSPTSAVQTLDQPAPVIALTSSVVSSQVSHGSLPIVHDSDLAQLASEVKLGQANTGDVGKDVWARETPVAQKLLQGLCDCDQRNWLKHFVQTGNQALTGSEEYYQSVQLLATLRRSNNEVSTNQVSH